MRKQLILGIAALVIGMSPGCGSNGSTGSDTRPPVFQDGGDMAVLPLPNPDGGCDDSAAGQNYCIINPGDGRGGGTVITRQNPASYLTCKQ